MTKSLQSSPKTGIAGTPADLARRVAAFGENKMPQPPLETWISMFLGCFGDEILILLIVAAVVSIIVQSIPSLSDHPET